MLVSTLDLSPPNGKRGRIDTLEVALADRGLLTRPTPTRVPKPLSRSQIAAMLVNPYYIGIVRRAGVEYQGDHEPLIDRQPFQRPRAVLEAHGYAEDRLRLPRPLR